MSRTVERHHPIAIRIPGRNLNQPADAPARHGPAVADLQVRELGGYRLARLEAEVLAPARGIASVDLRLRRIISAYVALAITDPGIMALLSGRRTDQGDAAPSPAVDSTIDDFIATLQENLAEVIGTQDRTPPIDPRVAVQSLFGIIHWGVTSHRTEGRLSRDEAAAQITFLALHGLAPRPEPSVRPLAQPRRWLGARLRGLRRAS